MPDFSPVTEVIHRTDASAVSLPWSRIRNSLASESYYKVEFKQPGSHNVVEVMFFVVKESAVEARVKETYRVVTTFEQYDISYAMGRECRKVTQSWLQDDTMTYDKLPEALTAAKVEAVLNHAHVKGFKFNA